MKKLALLIIALLVGCGDGGGGGSDSPPSASTAPIIASMRISPDTLSVGYGGGAATIDLYVDYYDAEGDISSYTVSSVKHYYDGSPDVTSEETNSFNGILDTKTSGTAHWESPADTITKRTTTMTIYFTDSAGNNSNTLTGTFEVQ